MMYRYWGRILTAFILLKAAQSVMKEAEQLLGDNLSTKESPVDTIESTATDVSQNGHETDAEIEARVMQEEIEA